MNFDFGGQPRGTLLASRDHIGGLGPCLRHARLSQHALCQPGRSRFVNRPDSSAWPHGQSLVLVVCCTRRASVAAIVCTTTHGILQRVCAMCPAGPHELLVTTTSIAPLHTVAPITCFAPCRSTATHASVVFGAAAHAGRSSQGLPGCCTSTRRAYHLSGRCSDRCSCGPVVRRQTIRPSRCCFAARTTGWTG